MEVKEDLRLALDDVAFARELLGAEPDAWQADLLRTRDAQQVLLLCSRQAGKTSVAAIIALRQALYHPRSLVLVLAPALRQSQEFFKSVVSFYAALGRPTSAISEQKLFLELSNGSRVVALPGTEKTIRGFSGAAMLIVDEAARVADDLYYSVRPMLAVSGGSLMLLSTPWGKRGVFYEEWTHGAGWRRYRVPAGMCPRISPEFLEAERQRMPALWYGQEYLCEFHEAEDQVFGHDDIQAALDTDEEPLFGGSI